MTRSLWSAADGPWRGAGIAIVGMAGRFPLADSAGTFWRNLLDGRDCISRFTREEVLREGVSPALVDHEHYVCAGAVLDGIDLFDAAFFGISPREAESMDPQQRLFLEVVQHAFDDAALDPQRYPGRIGVYAGARLSAYWLRLMKNTEFMAGLGWHQVAAGNDKDFLPTQASFRFGLQGPSVNVQAACSTSLLAVSLGCDALINGRCDVALAGAASIAVPQRTGYMYQPSSIASSNGRCRPFDADADGSVLGNGVAAVVLKRVDDALADRDRIVAVLRAVAVNNDGSSKSSFAAPSVRAQTDVLERALREAALTPPDIGYVEAHGTATLLGDPIEVAALARVFGSGPARPAPLPIGSVKSNVGHLDPVAGLASLIKAALCLQEQRIPSSLHFVRPNPAIDFAAAGVRVVAEAEDWPRGTAPRRAGVSAFGIGGTNVHAVLEEPPALPDAPNSDSPEPELLVLSAKSPEALDAMAHELSSALGSGTPAPSLREAAFTLSNGRRQFKHRRSVVASTPQQAATLLAQGVDETTAWLKDRPVVLMFPGQGSQRLGMGLSLYRSEPVFREAVDELLALAQPHLGFDARGLIDVAAHGNGGEHDLTQTAIAQPLLFAIEVACARLLMHWGLRPAQMLGHSIGELAAAHVAGVLPPGDAMRVVCRRGQLMQSMAPGAMLALPLAAEHAESIAQELAPADACIAAYNAPKQQTLSASLAAMARIEPQLRARGIAGARLATSHAFHHGSMREAADGLREVLAQVPLGVPELPLMSCVTGTPMSDEQATQPDYWSRSVVEPVRFAQAAAALLASHGDAVFIECGPGRALGSLLRAQGNGTAPLVLPALAAAGDVDADRRGMLSMVGRAWAAGVSVDWQAFWQHRPARRTRLPGYAFQRKRFWVDAPAEAAASAARPATAPAGALAPSAEHTFVRAWAPSPAASVAPTADAGARADFVVLTADPGFGMGLAQRLQRSGSRVVAVHAAPLSGAIAGVGAGVRSIDISDTDLRDADAAEALARRLVIGLRPDVPLHLVNALPLGLPPGVPSVDRAERGAWLAFHAPLRLLRALRSVQRHVAVMDTITMQLFPLLPGERPEPAAAPAMGLARVLPQEVQGLRARIIDIAQPRGGNDAPRVLDQLAAELLRLGAETVLAYRGEQRLVEGFAPVPLPRALRVRPGGCFLLTGGFGAIGSVLAKALAQASPGARIVLVGRRGLGDADGQAGQSARELVAALHRQGAEVLPVAADMSEPDAVRAVIGQVHARFGRIDGVVHCAGVAGGRMLMAPPDAVPGQVMVPKVRGTVALLEALSASAPDFVVLCSSFATISGGLGQGEYCAANAFLDAMAWSARAMGLRVTSIDWPAWRDAGMAVAMTLPPELEHLRRASLETGISSAEGAELFLRVLAADLPQVVIAPLPSRPALEPAVVPAAAARRAEAHVEHVGVEATAPESCEPAVGATPFPDSGSDEDPEVRRMLVERIGAIWSAVLGVTAPTAEDNFFELGGQSLMALQIVARCGEQFGISIGLPDVFDQPSLGGFAALVQRRMVQRVMAMPDEEVRQRLAGATP